MKKEDMELSSEQRKELLRTLKSRFEKNMDLHNSIEWEEVQTKLESNPGKLWSLNEMERTGGEPDVVGYDNRTDEYVFYDCSKESPKGRRSLCYDREALESRKENKPENNAIDMASAIRILLCCQRFPSLLNGLICESNFTSHYSELCRQWRFCRV